jgi:hypothetical protein
MSRKVLTVLVPITAIVVSMAIPSLAQATQAQCGATGECASNATIRLQTTNFKLVTQAPEFTIKCTAGTLAGTLNSSQAENLEGPITSDKFTGCESGLTEDVSTNAAAAKWSLQIQQPDANGQVTAHLVPSAGNSLSFTVQDQLFGSSVATCVYSGSTIQLMNTEQSDVFTVEGKEQLVLTASNNPELCGTVNTTKGDVSGSFQLENAAAEAVVVHMAEKP